MTMNHTRCLLAPTIASLALLAAPLGCGTEAPPSAASLPVVEFPAQSVAAEAGSPQPVATSSPAAEAPAALDRELRQDGQDVRQAAGAIDAQVGQAESRAARAVGEGRRRVDRAVTETGGQVESLSGEARDAVDQAKGDAKKAVGGAKDEVRRRARSFEQEVEKTGKDLKKEVVNDLLGPSNN